MRNTWNECKLSGRLFWEVKCFPQFIGNSESFIYISSIENQNQCGTFVSNVPSTDLLNGKLNQTTNNLQAAGFLCEASALNT